MIDTNADMRFMSNNFLETGYNTMSVSSVATGFYSTDLTTPERSRAFKFGGRFTIEATTKKIYVNATAYDLTPGEYSSPSALATHISTVIAASGVTCVWDEANGGKFKFSKASAFTLNASTVLDSVWTTIGVITGADLGATLEGATYIAFADVPRFHYPNEVIKLDFGYQASIGFIGIIGDLTKELRIPEGATITFQANNVDDFTAPPVNKTLTWTKRGVFGFIDDVEDSAWRYCKLILTHPEGPFQSEIGYLYIGDYSQFIDRNISVGIEVEYMDTSVISSSDDGQQYVNQKTPFRLVRGISVGLAKPANVNFLKRLFYLKQKAAPFFVALDPRVEISETIDDMTMYCRFASDPGNKHVLGKNFDLNFELVEAL